MNVMNGRGGEIIGTPTSAGRRYESIIMNKPKGFAAHTAPGLGGLDTTASVVALRATSADLTEIVALDVLPAKHKGFLAGGLGHQEKVLATNSQQGRTQTRESTQSPYFPRAAVSTRRGAP